VTLTKDDVAERLAPDGGDERSATPLNRG